MTERKTAYSVAAAICAASPTIPREALAAHVIKAVNREPFRSEIIRSWADTVAMRHIALRDRADPSSPGAKARAAEAAAQIVSRIAEKTRQNLFDTLRTPDGRLFADVPRYEYGALKREYSGWVRVIEAVKKYSRVTDDKMTARESIPVEKLETIVKENL